MRPQVLCLMLLLAGCGGEWSKPGGTEADLSAAQSACNNEAAEKAPPTLGRGPEQPGANIAPAYSCVPGKGCVPTGMSTAPTAPSVVDVNAEARAAIFNKCMADRGWSK